MSTSNANVSSGDATNNPVVPPQTINPNSAIHKKRNVFRNQNRRVLSQWRNSNTVTRFDEYKHGIIDQKTLPLGSIVGPLRDPAMRHLGPSIDPLSTATHPLSGHATQEGEKDKTGFYPIWVSHNCRNLICYKCLKPIYDQLANVDIHPLFYTTLCFHGYCSSQ